MIPPRNKATVPDMITPLVKDSCLLIRPLCFVVWPLISSSILNISLALSRFFLSLSFILSMIARCPSSTFFSRLSNFMSNSLFE